MKKEKTASLPARSPRESYVETNHLVLPSHANALQTIFGGVVMSWIDIAAAIAAQRHAKRVAVTASVDALYFLAPIRVGETVTLRARVVYTGRTSMIVLVEVTSEDPRESRPSVHCVTAYLSMVALGDDRLPVPVPPLHLTTPQEKRDYKSAAERRKYLLKRFKTEVHR